MNLINTSIKINKIVAVNNVSFQLLKNKIINPIEHIIKAKL